jgi:hypothetical protein
MIIYFANINFFGCLDIDECGNGHDCHVNATCTNTIGSYTCACDNGFSGNATICEGVYEHLDMQSLVQE